MNTKRLVFPALLPILFALITSAPAQEEHPWDGSRTVPVHLLNLRDEFDQIIIPTETYPLPFSSRSTCGPCHAYDTIEKGLHFNAGLVDRRGRGGEPWFWVDADTGTVLPLDYHEAPGIWSPRDLGLSPWEFFLMFGRHMNGGGLMSPGADEVSPESRWEVSGGIEIDCLGCHSASPLQSRSEWAKQVLRENFRWAATAAAGLGEVKGMASRLHGTWDIYDGPNPDDTEWAVPPSIVYPEVRFDSKHRIFFDIGKEPKDELCLTCHSVSPKDMPKYLLDEDVHTEAGLACVDCHRNDLGHQTVRGYDGEAADTGRTEAEALTCRGCHLGTDSGVAAGRMGAPYPRHRGLPPLHFERLTCTACHSGAPPGKIPTRVRTSRANRLGIYGVARWDTDFPHIIEPVFLKDRNGAIAPHRLVWPSFWAKRTGGGLFPLKPQEVAAAAAGILDTEQRIAQILNALFDPETPGTPVLVVGGRIFAPNIDGRLDVRPVNEEASREEEDLALEREDGVFPLIPDFDPEADPPDQDSEIRIEALLLGLSSLPEREGSPAFETGNSLYRISEGYLERVENPKGQAASPRLIWISGEGHQPLFSDFQIRTIRAITGREESLTEEQVAGILQNLTRTVSDPSGEGSAEYVYVAAGRMFELDSRGDLVDFDSDAAAPVTWPLAHQVRPARQSLGIGGCKQCHKPGSPFMFNSVQGSGPLLTDRGIRKSALAFLGMNKPYQTLFGLSFAVRPLFKTFLGAVGALIGALLLMILLLSLGRAAGIFEKRS